MFLALGRDPFSDSFDHFGDVFPRHRGLEGLSDEVIAEAEVTDVTDHESQEVASFSILWAGFEPFMFLGQRRDSFLLDAHLSSRPFKQNSTKRHLSRVEAHHLSNKVLLSCIDRHKELILILCLQSHPEHELLVVDQSYTRRPQLHHRN